MSPTQAGLSTSTPLERPLVLDAAASHHFQPDTKAAARPTPQAGRRPAVAAFAAHELTYLGYDGILDYAPVSATFRIWKLDRSAATFGAAPLMTPALTAVRHVTRPPICLDEICI